MSRSASLLLWFGGSGVGVKMCSGLEVRRAVHCVVGNYLRVSRFEVRRKFMVWGFGDG